jgi:hypothetical protein
MKFFIALAIAGLIMAAMGSHQNPCAQGICGNECMSSVDCLDGCVCLKENPPNNGICVSFD